MDRLPFNSLLSSCTCLYLDRSRKRKMVGRTNAETVIQLGECSSSKNSLLFFEIDFLASSYSQFSLTTYTTEETSRMNIAWRGIHDSLASFYRFQHHRNIKSFLAQSLTQKSIYHALSLENGKTLACVCVYVNTIPKTP